MSLVFEPCTLSNLVLIANNRTKNTSSLSETFLNSVVGVCRLQQQVIQNRNTNGVGKSLNVVVTYTPGLGPPGEIVFDFSSEETPIGLK